jgi:hypothetical protein
VGIEQPGFNGQNASNTSAIAIDTMGQRYGWAKALSTARPVPRKSPDVSMNS